MRAHKFPTHNDEEATCKFCGLKAKNEYKKPECKRNPGTLADPIPAKGKGDKPKATKKWADTGRCYMTHPELKLGGGTFIGGSCNTPKVNDADVYIGFQSGMRMTKRQFPWTEGTEIEFKVTDFHAPKDSEAKDYVALVEWTIEQLAAGKRVHAGCIGGHGRTGMFLAAVLAKLGTAGPIAHARAHYCKKAVESREQVSFLAKHFGCEADIDGAKPERSTSTSKGSSWESGDSTWGSPIEKYRDRFGTPKPLPKGEEITPLPTKGNVWGRTLDPEDY